MKRQTSYPPAPTPDELKNHSKKYMMVGGVIVIIIIAALVFVMLPKEAPPEIKEEVAPELGITNLISCTEYNEEVECITPKKSFTQNEYMIISYRVNGIELTQGEDYYILIMKKTVTITDDQGNEVAYTEEGFSKQTEVKVAIPQRVDEILAREIFDTSYLDTGAYTITIDIEHNGKTVQEQVQVEVI